MKRMIELSACFLILMGVAIHPGLMIQTAQAADPPALNPFSPKPSSSDGKDEPATLNPFQLPGNERTDTVPGYVAMSDGTVVPGMIYMTRDKRLKIFDEQLQRQREVPLRVVKQIDCEVLREWMEREWRFKELALNDKYYTGREYPTREYQHKITLQDDRTIEGPLAEIVYVRPQYEKTVEDAKYEPSEKPLRFLLNKRNKGEYGDKMESLSYVKVIKLGGEALEEGQLLAKKKPSKRK